MKRQEYSTNNQGKITEIDSQIIQISKLRDKDFTIIMINMLKLQKMKKMD